MHLSNILYPRDITYSFWKRQAYVFALCAAYLAYSSRDACADCPHIPQVGPSQAQWQTLALMSPVVSALANTASGPGPLSAPLFASLQLPAASFSPPSKKLSGAFSVLHAGGSYTISVDKLEVLENVMCRWPNAGQIRIRQHDSTLHVATFGQTCGAVVLDGQALILTRSSPAAPAPQSIRIQMLQDTHVGQ